METAGAWVCSTRLEGRHAPVKSSGQHDGQPSSDLTRCPCSLCLTPSFTKTACEDRPQVSHGRGLLWFLWLLWLRRWLWWLCWLCWLRWLWFRRDVGEMCLSISLHACIEFGWQNTSESDSRGRRHPRALDDQQLLAIEGSSLGLDVPMAGVRNMPHFCGKKWLQASHQPNSP